MTGFTVEPGALHAHAGQVDAVAAAVRTAAEAASQVQLGGHDYGLLMAPILDAVLPALLPNMSAALDHAADLADAIVDGLHANSDVYQRVEDDVRSSVSAVDR